MVRYLDILGLPNSKNIHKKILDKTSITWKKFCVIFHWFCSCNKNVHYIKI